MKKVGIFIKNSSSIFSNGCIQQSYFLLKTLRKTGRNVDFICIEDDYKKYELINEPVINVKNRDVLNNYNIIIFSSLIVTTPSIVSNFKMLGIKIINQIVGNYYFLNSEEFVFGLHSGLTQTLCNDHIDETWLMPMYTHNIEYIKMLTRKPVKISPYVWDPEIIDKYITINKINPYYNNTFVGDKINIVMFEPNLSIHKCSLPILCILNQYFLEYPDRLGEIYMLARPEKNPKCLDCISHFEIIKCNKVSLYDRHISLEIFNTLNKQNNKFLVMSGNIRNGLNFLNLECYHLNIPIIHNCIPLKDNNLYYEDSDYKTDYVSAINHINSVWKMGIKTQNKTSCLQIIDKYSTSNINNIENYKILLENVEKSYQKSNIYDFLTIFKNNNNYKINNLFSIVIPIYKNYSETIILKNIENIYKNSQNKYKVTYFVDKNCINKFNQINFINYDVEIYEVSYGDPSAYALSMIDSKYVFFMDQNTICCSDITDFRDVINKCTENKILGINIGISKSEKDIIYIRDFLSALYHEKCIDFNEDIMFDTKMFCYTNSSLIKNYFYNYNNNYEKLSLFIDNDYAIMYILGTTIKNISMLEHKKTVVCKLIKDDVVNCIGDCYSDNDSVIYLHLDNGDYISNKIKTDLLLIDFKNQSRYNIGKSKFRNVELCDTSLNIDI